METNGKPKKKKSNAATLLKTSFFGSLQSEMSKDLYKKQMYYYAIPSNIPKKLHLVSSFMPVNER